MHKDSLSRRRFLAQMALGSGFLATSAWTSNPLWAEEETLNPKKAYQGPNLVLIRFGGGVRRKETIEPQSTFAPFFCHELLKKGTFFPNMEIEQLEGVETSHGQGTLYLLTGKYHRYKDVGDRFLGGRFEAPVPTLFEYFRKTYQIPDYQTLIVNGEDRTDEEFYSFSNHHLFGADYRCNVLSLYRFKIYLLRKQLQEKEWPEHVYQEKQALLKKLESIDLRVNAPEPSPEIDAFWERWRQFYGDTGLVNPRGDRLLTELSIRALRELKPKLLLINYNDPDYVHWGYASHYTTGISIIDKGIEKIYYAIQSDPNYRDNTIFVIVPDCGRDNNRLMSVPYQHHFGDRCSHEIFGLFLGPGIPQGKTIDKLVQQIDVAPTIGKLMGYSTNFVEGSVLGEVFA